MELSALQPEADPRLQITGGYTASIPHVLQGYLGYRLPTRYSSAGGAIPRPNEYYLGAEPSWMSRLLATRSSGVAARKAYNLPRPGHSVRNRRLGWGLFKFSGRSGLQQPSPRAVPEPWVLVTGNPWYSHCDRSIQSSLLWTARYRYNGFVIIKNQMLMFEQFSPRVFTSCSIELPSTLEPIDVDSEVYSNPRVHRTVQ